MCEFYDFAFSFADEDREIIENIVKQLNEKKYKIFYDSYYEHLLVGKDLYHYLRDLYHNKGKYVVCFISENYNKKVWTTLEMTAIKERLLETFFADDFLIPIMLDDSINKDIPSFLCYYQFKDVESTVDFLDNKFRSSLNEDLLNDGTQTFIDYLSEQIQKQLICYNKNANLLKNNILQININGNTKCYCLKNDKVGYTPCIYLYSYNGESEAFEFPVLLLVWNKNNNLKFTIYNFSEPEKSFKNDVSFNDLIKHICKQITSFN